MKNTRLSVSENPSSTQEYLSCSDKFGPDTWLFSGNCVFWFQNSCERHIGFFHRQVKYPLHRWYWHLFYVLPFKAEKINNFANKVVQVKENDRNDNMNEIDFNSWCPEKLTYTSRAKTCKFLRSRISRGHQSIHLIEQGSLNYPFWRYQTIQMYGTFEGFPLNSVLFGLVIKWPLVECLILFTLFDRHHLS